MKSAADIFQIAILACLPLAGIIGAFIGEFQMRCAIERATRRGEELRIAQDAGAQHGRDAGYAEGYFHGFQDGYAGAYDEGLEAGELRGWRVAPRNFPDSVQDYINALNYGARQ